MFRQHSNMIDCCESDRGGWFSVGYLQLGHDDGTGPGRTATEQDDCVQG